MHLVHNVGNRLAKPEAVYTDNKSDSLSSLASSGVARNLMWVGINLRHTLVTGTISNLSWVKETKQPHKNF